MRFQLCEHLLVSCCSPLRELKWRLVGKDPGRVSVPTHQGHLHDGHFTAMLKKKLNRFFDTCIQIMVGAIRDVSMMDHDTNGRLPHRSWNHSKGDGFEVKWPDRDFKSVDMIDQIGRNLFKLARLHDIAHLGPRRRETLGPDVLLKRFSTTFRLRDRFKSDHPFGIEIRQGGIHFHLCLAGLGQTNQNCCRQSYVSHLGHRSFYGSRPMTGVKKWLTFSELGSLILDCPVTEKKFALRGMHPIGFRQFVVPHTAR